MFSQEQDYYVRFILLLIQGGTALLRGITKKALGRMNKSLVDFLSSVKPKIEKTKNLSNTQKSTLYPEASQSENGQTIDAECLDITLLSYLIIHYLTQFLEDDEIGAVIAIRDLRNKYHAHTAETKMTFNVYIKAWTKLVTTITKISSGMSEEEQGTMIGIIDSVADTTLNMNTLTSEFNLVGDEKLLFESIIQSIFGIRQDQRQMFEEVKEFHKDILDMKTTLVQLKDKLENHGKTTTREYTVYARIEVCAKDPRAVESATTALLAASRDIISKTELNGSKEEGNRSQRDVKEKLRKVVEDVDQLGIRVETVNKGSVKFQLKCDSLTKILDLIDYFIGTRLQNRLEEVALALEEIFQQKFCISGFIDSHCIKNVITELQEEEHKNVVQMRLTCIGIDGLCNALEVFEEGSASNSFNELSTALTAMTGIPVTLHMSIDLHQMQSSIVSIQNHLALDAEVNSSKTKEGLKIENRQGETSVLGNQATVNFGEESLDFLLESSDDDNEKSPRKRKKRQFAEMCDYSSHLDEAKLSKGTNDSLTDSVKTYEGSIDEQNALHLQSPLHRDEAGTSTRTSGYLDCKLASDRNPPAQPVGISTGQLGLHSSLTHIYDIDVSTKTDKDTCDITGIVILPGDRMAVADHKNFKIKIVDLQNRTVVNERKLKFAPWDVTALPGDRIATTLCNSEEIVILNVDDQMAEVRSVNINRKCWGICLHDNLIYVACWNPNSVLVLEIEGTIRREISLENAGEVTITYPRAIALNDKVQHLCVSDFNGSFVARVTLEGDITGVQHYENLTYPQGMVMLEDGSLLVCCESGSLFHVSADLTHIKRLTKHVPKARAICYQPSSRKVYASSQRGDLIKVFTLT